MSAVKFILPFKIFTCKNTIINTCKSVTFFSSELCLTSNVKCRTVKSYEDHHFKDWRKNNHPIVICVSKTKYGTTSAHRKTQLAASLRVGFCDEWKRGFTLSSVERQFRLVHIQEHVLYLYLDGRQGSVYVLSLRRISHSREDIRYWQSGSMAVKL